MDDEQYQHLEDLLQIYRRRIRPLEKQAAQYGPRTDPQVLMEMDDIRTKIVHIEQSLGISETYSKTDVPTETTVINCGLTIPVSSLEIGMERARSVAQVKCDVGLATGFLIKDNIFVTNQHVIPTPEIAKTASIRFNHHYASTIMGATEVEEFHLDYDSFFKTSMKYDLTLVRVKGDANANWGAIEILPIEIDLKDKIHAICHPGGMFKHVSFSNTILYIGEDVIQYLTDSMHPNSGSPIFNDQWHLVAIHRAGGSFPNANSDDIEGRNEGVITNCIIHMLSNVKDNS